MPTRVSTARLELAHKPHALYRLYDRTDVLERTAARHAVMWHSMSSTVEGMCHGPGKHGARCRERAEARAWYKQCPRCDYGRRPCEGHAIWCMPHTIAAVAGHLRHQDPHGFMCFAIERFEEIRADDPWKVVVG